MRFLNKIYEIVLGDTHTPFKKPVQDAIVYLSGVYTYSYEIVLGKHKGSTFFPLFETRSWLRMADYAIRTPLLCLSFLKNSIKCYTAEMVGERRCKTHEGAFMIINEPTGLTKHRKIWRCRICRPLHAKFFTVDLGNFFLFF